MGPLTPQVAYFSFRGVLPAEAALPGAEVLEAMLAKQKNIVMLGDGRDWQTYAPGYRSFWVSWFREKRESVTGVHLLVRSAILKMGVQMVNLAISGRITAYSNPTRWENVVRAYEPAFEKLVEGKWRELA